MARKSTPIEKAARMLDLVPFINSHQGISTLELANEFGISESELLSDLNALWMCGDDRFDLIDLQFDSGYVTIRNADTLNIVRSLSRQEIISLLLGLELVEKNLPDQRGEISEEISSLRKKLGKEVSQTLDATPAHDGVIASTLRRAQLEQRRVSITYFSPTDDAVTEREIAPLEIYVSENNEFLLAFCFKASAHRTFRVDRVRSASILDTTGDLVLQADTEVELISSTISISRQLRRSREALGKYLTGDGAEVQVSSYSSEWLLRTVISSAGAMEVLSSDSLRDQVRKRAQASLDLYR